MSLIPRVARIWRRLSNRRELSLTTAAGLLLAVLLLSTAYRPTVASGVSSLLRSLVRSEEPARVEPALPAGWLDLVSLIRTEGVAAGQDQSGSADHDIDGIDDDPRDAPDEEYDVDDDDYLEFAEWLDGQVFEISNDEPSDAPTPADPPTAPAGQTAIPEEDPFATQPGQNPTGHEVREGTPTDEFADLTPEQKADLIRKTLGGDSKAAASTPIEPGIRVTAPDGTIINSTALGEGFNLTVDLPEGQVKGDTLSIVVANADNDKVTIKIPRAATQPGGGMIRFHTTTPVSLAGRSTTTRFDKDGTITGLDQESNGGMVTFTVQGFNGIAALSVFDDEIQLGIAQGSETLSSVFDALMVEQRTLRQFRDDPEAAGNAALMTELDNWQKAIDNRLYVLRRGRESITRAQRPIDKLALTKYFLDKLLTVDPENPGAGMVVVTGVDPRDLEEYQVIRQNDEYLKQNLINQVATGYTKGIYSAFVQFTMVAPIRQIIIGKDEFNQDASRMDAVIGIAKGLVMMAVPIGAMRWAQGKNMLPSTGVTFRNTSGGYGRVLVAKRPGGGALSAQTAGGRLAYPTSRTTRGLSEMQIRTYRDAATRNLVPSANRAEALARADADIARIDANIVKARERGVSDAVIDRVLQEAGEMRPSPASDYIGFKLDIEASLANRERILVAADEIFAMREYATPEQISKLTKIETGVISEIKGKLALEMNGKPQIWTPQEMTYVNGIVTRLRIKDPIPYDNVATWRRVNEVLIENSKGEVISTEYAGLEPVFTAAELEAFQKMDWSKVQVAAPTPPSQPVQPGRGFPPGPGSDRTAFDSGAKTTVDRVRVPPGEKTDASIRISQAVGQDVVIRPNVAAAEFRARYGENTPAARAVEIAVQELGPSNVEGIYGSYAKGQARIMVWPEGLSYRDVKILSKLGEYTPQQVARLPERVQQLYQLRRPKKEWPSDVDIAVNSDIDIVVTEALAERIFNETGVLVEFTDASAFNIKANASSVPRTPPPSPPPAAPPPTPPNAPSGAAAGQAAIQKPATMRLSVAEVIPPEIMNNVMIARRAGVPNEVINRIIREQVENTGHPLGQLNDAIAERLEVAIQLQRGRVVVAEVDMPIIRQYATPDEIRTMIQVKEGGAILSEAVSQAIAQVRYQKGQWGQPTWTPEQVAAAKQMLAEGEGLLKWKQFVVEEYRSGNEMIVEYDGLIAVADKADLGFLRAVDWSKVKIGPGQMLTNKPISIPVLPRIQKVINPQSNPAAVGGPSGRTAMSAAPEVLIESKGGSTGPVLMMHVVNGGKPFRMEGDFVLEQIDPATLDAATRARIAEIRAAASAGKPQGPGGPHAFDEVIWLGAARLTTVTLDGYCLQFDRAVPTAGAIFRIAERSGQRKQARLLSIPTASRQLRAAKQLHPDSDPEAYFHSITQWSIWTREKSFNRTSFESEFVVYTRKNFEGAGHQWTKDAEEAVRKLVPNRWADITAVLNAAEANTRAQ